MNKYITKSALALGLVAILGSCSLEEYNPLEADTSASLKTDFTKWYGFQTKCYQPIYSQMYTVWDFLSTAELGTDTWISAKNSTNTQELFYYTGLVPFVNKGWDKFFMQAYSALATCNAAIEYGNELALDDSQKPLLAEAYFLRGYYHLMLTTYYGPITLVTKNIESGVELNPKRNTLTEIYNSVTSDLEYALANLEKTPYNNNRARATKKSALGMLCRAYVQAAGQGLTAADGQSYWQKAASLAKDFVEDTNGSVGENGGTKYGAVLYNDIADVWNQANNRNNKEALFVAAGIDANADQDAWNSASASTNKLFTYTYMDPCKFSDIFHWSNNKQDYYYGRTNNNLLAPSKYLVNLFDANWDKRWENSFQCAFGSYTVNSWSFVPKTVCKVITQAIADKYQMDNSVVGETIYPYVDIAASASGGPGGNQYTASVYRKGTITDTGGEFEESKNPYVIAYDNSEDAKGLARDENRICLFLAKDESILNDKAGRRYAIAAINDLFDSDGNYYSTNTGNALAQKYGENTPMLNAFPSLNKFNWSYDGVFHGSNLQVKNGDIFIMRAAEVYLIAAEAYQKLGQEQEAAKYINMLRARSVRADQKANTSEWQLTSASEQDVLDEYARELCGEHQRWAVLQRHQAFTTQLPKGNKQAAANFRTYHKWRPISQTFLQQIDNAEEYGDNGYGTTSKSGLDGYEQ